MSEQQSESRSVLRAIEPGNSALCASCGAPVKFVARAQLKQVIANVYIDGAWNRVEHYHEDCYEIAERPYGEPQPPAPRGGGSQAAAQAAAAQAAAAKPAADAAADSAEDPPAEQPADGKGGG